MRRLYAGWERGDYAVAMEAFAPDVELTISWGVDQSSWRGRAELRRAWSDFLRNWHDFSSGAIEQLLEQGDRILAINRISGRGRHADVPVAQLAGVAFTFREGKVVSLLLSDAETLIARFESEGS